jgi:chromosome segregation ATPase
MNARTITWINAIGCLVLVALVVVQWRGEYVSGRELANLKTSLAEANTKAAAETARCVALERDLQVLKEAAEQSGKAVESGKSVAMTKDTRIVELEAALKQAGGDVDKWQAAIAQRDDRIRKLEDEVAEARRRLNEAVAKLKAAGAR